MWVIIFYPYADDRKAYFKGYECGIQSYSFVIEEAVTFKTKKEALRVAGPRGIVEKTIE